MTQQIRVSYSWKCSLKLFNETMYLLGNLSFFKFHVNCFMAGDDSPCAPCYLKMHVVGEGPDAILSVLR